MENMTVINRELNEAPQTVINKALLSCSEADLLAEGDVICGKYTVESRLSVRSGEADIYICKSEGQVYAAKVYRREAAVKSEITELLKSIDSPYVAKIYKTDTVNGFPVDIIPYYKNGSLQGKRFTYDEITSMIIPCINEGLNAIHSKGIIHKDLKPSNIMMADDEKSVVLIDFGISSVRSGDNTVLLTKTGMTPEYSAPETFRNLFLEESDYYSFGISLFELFSGRVPYTNMSAEEIEQYVLVQKIPFPDDMPVRLKDFISALTYYDITNRKNKANPNRRWTYEEVKMWLDGKSLEIPGEAGGNISSGAVKPYIFAGEAYTDPALLMTAMAKDWNEGKKQLYRGKTAAHFRAFNREFARQCMEAEEEAGRANGKDDFIFWKLLYRVNPKLKAFYWKENMFESLAALGRDMLERLRNNDRSLFKYYQSVLSEKLLSEYVSMTEPKNEGLKEKALSVEGSYLFELNNDTDFTLTFYLMAYLLSGQRLLVVRGQEFKTASELADYIKSLLDESLEAFKAFCYEMVTHYGKLDSQLEAWLIVNGKQNAVKSWRESLNG